MPVSVGWLDEVLVHAYTSNIVPQLWIEARDNQLRAALGDVDAALATYRAGTILPVPKVTRRRRHDYLAAGRISSFVFSATPAGSLGPLGPGPFPPPGVDGVGGYGLGYDFTDPGSTVRIEYTGGRGVHFTDEPVDAHRVALEMRAAYLRHRGAARRGR